MARTKQTARKCLVPRMPLATKSISAARKSAPIKKQLKRKNRSVSDSSDSQSEAEDNVVNNQQFSVKFDDQAKCEEQAVEAQIVSCTNCAAIHTSQSKRLTIADYKKLQEDPTIPDEKKQRFLKNLKATNSVWICEFCLVHNAIAKSYDPPQVQNPCFLIQKAKKPKGKKEEQNDDENRILIFCIDISTSMDTTVLGNKTRLDTVKEAIIDEINRMKSEKEVIKVGLVTFGSIVSLIGDGKTFKEKNVNNAIYNDFEKIVEECSKVRKFASPIAESHTPLKKKIESLGVYGSTALGPGLLASIQIASKGAVGSKVIICTDGQANVGVGGIWGNNNQNQPFYEKAATFAKTKRVSVSILSLKGDRCNLKELGKLSLASGGSILKIEPSALGTEFSKIAKEQVLGTSSQLVIKVNKIFQIVSHVPNQLSPDHTTLTQDFGNFSSQTELTFQFKVLTKEQADKKPGVELDLFNQHQVPMQVQLTYIGRNGNKYMQVITDWRELTEDEKAIYDGANFGLFAASVLQRASTKIKAQQFSEAEKIVKGYWAIVEEKFSKTQNVQELTKFADRVKKIQIVLNSKMKKKGKKQSTVQKKTTLKRKTVKKAKKSTAQKARKIQSKRGRQRSRSVSSSESQSSDSERMSDSEGMSSDEEEQILWKEMRARSRSNSPEEKKKTTTKRK